MAWYGVHVVMAVRFKSGDQETYPAWENIYLIDADSEDEAERKAEAIGHADEGDSSGTFYWEERPAEWVYRGVRRIIEVANPQSVKNEPGDGAEITYQSLEFENDKALEDYVHAVPTTVTVVD